VLSDIPRFRGSCIQSSVAISALNLCSILERRANSHHETSRNYKREFSGSSWMLSRQSLIRWHAHCLLISVWLPRIVARLSTCQARRQRVSWCWYGGNKKPTDSCVDYRSILAGRKILLRVRGHRVLRAAESRLPGRYSLLIRWMRLSSTTKFQECRGYGSHEK